MPKGDKYIKLFNFLSNQNMSECILSFSEIENILGFNLPNSAYIHKEWWANDFNHSQALAWLNNNIRTKDIRLNLKIIVFYKYSTSVKTQVPNEPIKTKCYSNDNHITIQPNSKNIELNGYIFYLTSVAFIETDISNIFLNYKGKTVNELLTKKYYSNLRSIINLKYSSFLEKDISTFMKHLKETNDTFYLEFLNKNGSDLFCHFKLTDNSIYGLKGLYAYLLDDKLRYIGRCRDSFNKRFNVNYGVIQPINCYKEGQSTNTHINSLMNEYKERISIYICPINDISEIEKGEKVLISTFSPEWNRQK